MSKKKKNVHMENLQDQDSIEKKEKIKGLFLGERVIADENGVAKEVYEQSRFGEPKDNKIQYALVEALYLMEKGRMEIIDDKDKKVDFDDFVKRVRKFESNFWIKYVVYRDMRSRGYIVKTALKFGADFRVYDRGIKPGEDHAKWVLYPVHEGSSLTWHDLSAKNRVAHSTRKRLLLGIVDEENDVTFLELRWLRP